METRQSAISTAVAKRYDFMVDLRRRIHRNPELSGQEYQTSHRLAELFDQAGMSTRFGPSDRGIIADLKISDSDSERPMLAMRADIDALRIQDQKQVDYASQLAGVMHACGHDAHTAIVTGAILTLQELQQQGIGTNADFRAIFQPSEETCEGAREMISAGALQGVSCVLATHVDPSRRVGTVGLRRGTFTAACDNLRVIIHGQGGHAARPHEARDPITAAAQFINWVYLQVPRGTDSQESVVITFGQIQGGNASNIIPETVELLGTMRTLEPDIRCFTMQRITEIAQAVADASRTQIEVEFEIATESIQNDDHMVHILENAASQTLGDENVELIARPSMGGEDFAFFTSQVPGAMWRLGCVSNDRGGAPLHSPTFDIDERALAIGAELFVTAAITWCDNLESGTQGD